MAGSQTSMTASLTVITHQNHSIPDLTLINGAGRELKQGETVNIKAGFNYTVEKTDSGTADFPIGTVIVGGVDGVRISVLAAVACVAKKHAKGGTINAGTFVKPNGTLNADGLEEVVAAASGDYVHMIVIKGGAVDTVLEVIALSSPLRMA